MMPILACSTSFLLAWLCLSSADFVAHAQAAHEPAAPAAKTVVLARPGSGPGATAARPAVRLAAGRTYSATLAHRRP